MIVPAVPREAATNCPLGATLTVHCWMTGEPEAAQMEFGSSAKLETRDRRPVLVLIEYSVSEVAKTSTTKRKLPSGEMSMEETWVVMSALPPLATVMAPLDELMVHM